MINKRLLLALSVVGVAVWIAVVVLRRGGPGAVPPAIETATVGAVAPAGPASATPVPAVVVRGADPEVSMRVGLDGCRKWAEQWEQADEAARATMIGEGRVLAEARRETMKDLIRQDPQRAIEEALPYKYRKALPMELASLIEHPVRGVGDYRVLGVAWEHREAQGAPVRRVTEVNGRYYETHVEQWASGEPMVSAMGGAGSSGGFSTVVPATKAQGNKRLLAIRLRFPEQAATYEPATDAVMQAQLQRVVDDFAASTSGRFQSSCEDSRWSGGSTSRGPRLRH